MSIFIFPESILNLYSFQALIQSENPCSTSMDDVLVSFLLKLKYVPSKIK